LTNIAVFGTGIDAQTIAADLTLSGHQVNILGLPEQKNKIEYIKNNGIYLHGDETVSGKTGLTKINIVTTDCKEALQNVEVIIFANPSSDYEYRIKLIAPYLGEGQIINFNTYGYWPSLRITEYLKETGKNDVILTESPAPIYWSGGKDGNVIINFLRKNVPLAAFPAIKNKEAFNVLKKIFPQFEIAKNVLQTNLENVNLLVHPAIILLNIGWFDRAEIIGESVGFYKTGNTVHTGIFQELLDKERLKICEAYKVRALPINKCINNLYGAQGKNMYEITKNCTAYQKMNEIPPKTWITWTLDDVPLALVPAAHLADVAGVSVPLLKGVINILGSLIEKDFWETGLTLERLGLNISLQEITKYVFTGKK